MSDENQEVYAEAAESPIVPLYRMTNEAQVDAFMQEMGWEGGHKEFNESMQQKELSGDAGPYVGWFVEGDELGEPLELTEMQKVEVKPVFCLSELGTVIPMTVEGYQEPMEPDIVYVERHVFEAMEKFVEEASAEAEGVTEQ